MKKETKTTDMLTVVRNDASQIIVKAEQLSIETKEELEEATEILSSIKHAQKKIKEEKDKVLAPLLTAVEAERNRWRDIESQTNGAEKIIKGKMEDFVVADQQRAQEEIEKLNKQFADRKIKKEGTLARKMSLVDAPTTSVATASGASIKTRMIDIYNYDVQLIPREYLLPNEALIKAALKTSKKDIPGVVVTKKPSIAAR